MVDCNQKSKKFVLVLGTIVIVLVVAAVVIGCVLGLREKEDDLKVIAISKSCFWPLYHAYKSILNINRFNDGCNTFQQLKIDVKQVNLYLQLKFH